MRAPPHRNASRLYACPLQRLVAILDDQKAVENAFAQLPGIDVDVSGGHVLYVPADDTDCRERIATALLAAGGHDLVHVGRIITGKRWT